MSALVVAMTAIVLGIAVHAALLRRLPASWRVPALPVVLLLALALLSTGAVMLGLPFGWADGVVALVLTLSLGFAWALLLNGVLHDSPTLALVDAIEAHGDEGMPVEAFVQCVARHPFFANRVDALIAIGELEVEGDRLRLSGKAGYLLRLGDAYRRLRGEHAKETG